MRSDICSRWPKKLASQHILENSGSAFFGTHSTKESFIFTHSWTLCESDLLRLYLSIFQSSVVSTLLTMAMLFRQLDWWTPWQALDRSQCSRRRTSPLTRSPKRLLPACLKTRMPSHPCSWDMWCLLSWWGRYDAILWIGDVKICNTVM